MLTGLAKYSLWCLAVPSYFSIVPVYQALSAFQYTRRRLPKSVAPASTLSSPAFPAMGVVLAGIGAAAASFGVAALDGPAASGFDGPAASLFGVGVGVGVGAAAGVMSGLGERGACSGVEAGLGEGATVGL